MINPKGVFLPLQYYQGNTIDLSFEYILNKDVQTDNDVTLIGAINDKQDVEVERLQISYSDGLFHVTGTSQIINLEPEQYIYEIVAVHKATKKVTTILRGSFQVFKSSTVNV